MFDILTFWRLRFMLRQCIRNILCCKMYWKRSDWRKFKKDSLEYRSAKFLLRKFMQCFNIVRCFFFFYSIGNKFYNSNIYLTNRNILTIKLTFMTPFPLFFSFLSSSFSFSFYFRSSIFHHFGRWNEKTHIHKNSYFIYSIFTNLSTRVGYDTRSIF